MGQLELSGKFPAILPQSNTFDLSRRLFIRNKAGGLNRRANNKTAQVRRTSFSARMAFWLGLVLVLLPRDPTPDPKDAAGRCRRSHIGGERRSLRRMGQFCRAAAGGLRGRRQAATAIGQRAQDGARRRSTRHSPTRSPDHGQATRRPTRRTRKEARPHRLDRRRARRCSRAVRRRADGRRYGDRMADAHGRGRLQIRADPVHFRRFRPFRILYRISRNGRGPR